MAGKIQKVDFITTKWQDQKMVLLEIAEKVERVSGIWSLNVSLLKDKNYVKLILRERLEFKKFKNEFSNEYGGTL